MKYPTKWLHIELNPNGLYVYCDNNKRGHKEVRQSDMDEECCLLHGLDPTQTMSLFKDKIAVRIDVSKLHWGP